MSLKHVCLHLVDDLPEAADKLSMILMHCMHSRYWSSCCCKDNISSSAECGITQLLMMHST